MVKKSIVVKLDQKTDVMPIAMLVQVASQYESSIKAVLKLYESFTPFRHCP